MSFKLKKCDFLSIIPVYHTQNVGILYPCPCVNTRQFFVDRFRPELKCLICALEIWNQFFKNKQSRVHSPATCCTAPSFHEIGQFAIMPMALKLILGFLSLLLCAGKETPSFSIDYEKDTFLRNGKPHRWKIFCGVQQAFKVHVWFHALLSGSTVRLAPTIGNPSTCRA